MLLNINSSTLWDQTTNQIFILYKNLFRSEKEQEKKERNGPMLT